MRLSSRILRELIRARASSLQFASYVAVMSGLRRSLDDWIPQDRFDQFTRLASRLGLTVLVDCLFQRLTEEPAPLRASLVPTTRAIAKPWSEVSLQESSGTVHVFISRRCVWAEEALAAGWYPVVVNGRVLTKPLVDHGRLGKAFGYPDCCVDFFLSYNDWPRWNTLAESLKNSAQLRWECNCIAKHTPWMIIYHMPCSFDCRSTMQYSRTLLETIGEISSTYAEQIRAYLNETFLVLNEVLCYRLAGVSAPNADGSVSYRRAIYLGSYAQNDRLGQVLSLGNRIAIEAGNILLFRDSRLVNVIETCCDAGPMDVPLLLKFR